jgi:hypothetical protein
VTDLIALSLIALFWGIPWPHPSKLGAHHQPAPGYGAQPRRDTASCCWPSWCSARFRSRPGTRLVIASVVLFLLVALVQSLLAGLADDTVWFGGLHALDGLAILGIATFLYLAARRRHS